jgi:hypothetical protein
VSSAARWRQSSRTASAVIICTHLLQRPSHKDAVGGLQGSDSHRGYHPVAAAARPHQDPRVGKRRSCPQQDLTHCVLDGLEPLAACPPAGKSQTRHWMTAI